MDDSESAGGYFESEIVQITVEEGTAVVAGGGGVPSPPHAELSTIYRNKKDHFLAPCKNNINDRQF